MSYSIEFHRNYSSELEINNKNWKQYLRSLTQETFCLIYGTFRLISKEEHM
jgi:hypothetical protein